MTRVISVISQNAQAFFSQSLIQGFKHEGLVPHHIALGDFSDLEGDVIITLDTWQAPEHGESPEVAGRAKKGYLMDNVRSKTPDARCLWAYLDGAGCRIRR